MHRILRLLPVLFVATLFSVLLVAPERAYAVGVEIGSSPNPVGSGARATGMGGAFIAVADDATAASWNPAGLVQLERPEVSVVWGFSPREEKVSSISHPEMNGTNRNFSTDLNYLSAAVPFTVWDRNVVMSVNYQRLYDFNMEFNGGFNDVFAIPGFSVVTVSRQRFKQTGGLSAISPAVAFQITPSLSAGFTVNFWQDPFRRNGWTAVNDVQYTDTITVVPFPPVTTAGTFRNIDDNTFGGTNFNAGLMYSPSANLTLGAVYKDGFTANVKRIRKTFNTATIPTNTNFKDYFTISMPRSYGVGASYRLSDEFSAALDVYRTEWSEFVQVENGRAMRPNIGKLESASEMDATNQVRAGCEYLFVGNTYVVPVRGGVFYDPDPSENAPNDFYGVSVGSGVSFDRASIDFSYTYRTGKTGEHFGAGGTDSRIDQHQVLVSAIMYF